MDQPAKPATKKGKKVTILDEKDEIPVRQPSRCTPTVVNPVAGTASDPDQQTPGGAAFQHEANRSNIHGANNYPVNEFNPINGQSPQFHHTAGSSRFPHCFPSGVCNPHNNTTTLPGAHFTRYVNPNFLPPTSTHRLPAALISLNPSTSSPHHYYYSVSNYNSIMDDYGNGFMPNTGQHFQPPVPDTTYGPIPHVYNPRFDNGFQAVGNGVQGMPWQPALPYAYPYPAAPFAQQQVAPAPMAMPVMGLQQPFPGAQSMPVYHQGIGPQVMAAAIPSQGFQGPIMGGFQGPIAPGNGAPSAFPVDMIPPDIMGIGKTSSETMHELLESMHKGNLLEPQDIKPADDDPSRMYLCRELDNNWTKRSRFTIDRLPCRWYLTPWGAFYAVRLEE
ncbi:hypothetical protein BX600DRAFT_433295 [Xylariales sp. PMI_506]|nr:hypothetical protein BX600DRAFT_433295 [Xylariales sp. PMI_506]